MKRFMTYLFILLLVASLGLLTACGGDDNNDTTHTCTPGAAATCITAQTCTDCGEVIVAALGHNFTHNNWIQ